MPAPSLKLETPRERVSPGRTTIGVARALDDLARSLPDVIYSKAAKPTPYARAVEREKLAREEQPNTPVHRKKTLLPEKDKLTLAQDTRDGRSCKKRPEDNRGSGGSRSFVPWCSRFK